MSDVTRILNAIEQGDAKATEELLPLVYEELRLLAAQKLAQEKPGQTLQATALVHEAYLRLVGNEPPTWSGRGHFFAAAAEAMRRILVDNARRKGRFKRGGAREQIALDEVSVPLEESPEDMIALDEALTKLARAEPEAFELVRLRYFAGLTQQQAADILGMPHRTADRTWAYARAWLYQEMTRGYES
ncbi:MAG: sigma-70 family RNA polymerase sigma factor [Planctomycetes bacterium]|jgi:RNA polymerase sigma factor (TIGR02999 family)|nr:sigma-70 family RNA polymerase sigma factor [Planctomycetota bacterium]